MSKTPIFGGRSVFVFSFLLLTFAFPLNLHAETKPVVSYRELLSSIREVRNASESRIEAAVAQEKVREAWETGKLMDEHILLHKERQEYGAQVVIKLAKDLGTSETELKYMLQFARTYPIRPAPDELSWSHYRELLSINDTVEREAIKKEAVAQGWSQKELFQKIKKRKFSSLSSPPASGWSASGGNAPPFVGDPELPETHPGKIGARAVIELNGKHYEDLGFSFYSETTKPVQTPPLEDLYTYPAHATSVYDGDTFHALIDLGNGRVTRQRVRLSRVDAPEIESSEGKEAKAFLEKIFARKKGEILLKTYGFDQHGRPLADVFIAAKSTEPDESGRSRMKTLSSPHDLGGDPEYINVDQELVDQGLASVIQE